jgi:hypothetical protein
MRPSRSAKTPTLRSLLPLPLLAIPLALLALAGCGGSSESLTTIQGDSGAISKPMLDHWMRAMAGGDFRQNIGTKGPEGLVSEPANYAECEAAAAKIVPRTYTGQLKLSKAQINQKCHQLYHSLKAQALSFLISVQWAVTEGKEAGFEVSEALLHKEFARTRKQTYPTETLLRRYLQERHWSLSDVLYQLKRNILVRKLLPTFQAKVKQAGGGEATYAKLALERYSSLVSKTSCKPGYVVPNCRQYHGPPSVEPSPDVIIEAFVQATKS